VAEPGPCGIVGHGENLRALRDMVLADRLHHAYLFEGPAGIGKQLVALWLAQLCNCDAAVEDRPCGTCRPCRLIRSGQHPDVIRLAPEEGRATPIVTVAQVREVTRQMGYRRFSGKRRFIIVDPAESLPPPSANALLKSLEEPPEGTGFILIASHAASLLPTIRSRCQRLRFSAMAVGQLEAWLTDKGESHPAQRARIALGCPGLALALSDERLEERVHLRDTALRAAGSGDLEQIFSFSQTICEGGRAQWRDRVDDLFAVIEDLLRDAAVHASQAEVPLLDDERLAERAALRLWPHGVVRIQRALEDARAALDVNATGRTVVDALMTRLSVELGRLPG
jgi:DNA polymerase-3 subunit delta'